MAQSVNRKTKTRLTPRAPDRGGIWSVMVSLNNYQVLRSRPCGWRKPLDRIYKTKGIAK
jgi:hypothetical protein